MGFLFILSVIAISAIAYKTNPDDSSFTKFYSASQKASFLSKLFTRVDFVRKDYGLFSVVTVKDQFIFIGIFHSWIPINGASETPSDKQNEDQYEVYEKQANSYKKSKDMKNAALYFTKAAQACREEFTKATLYEEAYKSYQASNDVDNSINALLNVVRCFEGLNKFSRAAKASENLAVLYQRSRDLRNALKFQLAAADYYSREGDKRAIHCNLAAADCMLQLDDYENAFKMYDSLLSVVCEDSLLKFQVPAKAFNACLCLIAMKDFVRLKKQCDLYFEAYPMFSSSQEGLFLQNACAMIESQDLKAYAEALHNFCKYHTGLENFKVGILKSVEKAIEQSDLT